MKTRTLVIILWLFALVCWNVIVWREVLTPDNHLLKVTFLDIGQGDAAFIEAPNGVQMLIDGGPDSAVLQQLRQIMRWNDHSIDIILATHDHADHTEGLKYVRENYDVKKVIDNNEAIQGMKIILDEEENIYFEVYYPASTTIPTNDPNDMSIVGKLVYGENGFLFTGDSYVSIETKLINWCKACLDADVLKAGHHGSRTSTSQTFIEAVQPDYAIISVGRENKYGLPDEDVIERLEKAKINTFLTSEEGMVMMESDGKIISTPLSSK